MTAIHKARLPETTAIAQPILEKQQARPELAWDQISGYEEAVRMSRYLRRLDGLLSSGEIDEKAYDRLRSEYEQKLREAVESP